MSEASAIVSSLYGMGLLLGLVLGLALATMLFIVYHGFGRRTKDYRKDLTNLYVAGKIRQIADNNDINISEEYEMFKKYVKKRKMEDWDLDVTIEEELKEEIDKKKKEKVGA